MKIALRAWSVLCAVIALFYLLTPPPDLALVGVAIALGLLPWGIVWAAKGTLR
jgi:hypothetical protein